MCSFRGLQPPIERDFPVPLTAVVRYHNGCLFLQLTGPRCRGRGVYIPGAVATVAPGAPCRDGSARRQTVRFGEAHAENSPGKSAAASAALTVNRKQSAVYKCSRGGSARHIDSVPGGLNRGAEGAGHETPGDAARPVKLGGTSVCCGRALWFS